jgi:putative peptide zinc metalloprotease protein
MAVERPTFHEAWYRVEGLRPQLLKNVRVHRQHFRGELSYVLEDASSNKFSNLSSEAYAFLGLLDGRRTVAEAWQLCNQQQGDSAPTQGEVIGLLGQLYCANLLYAEVAPDIESLFQRHRKRLKGQALGFASNLLFPRIPLLDPDAFLNRWVGLVGKFFTVYGLVAWLVLLAAGLYFVIEHLDQLVNSSSNVLAPGNLVLLYVTFTVVKAGHEFGHAFACKHFGRSDRDGGQVHVMGVMFLVFMPMPYVDASSAWAFRNKWHRALVGAAGLVFELAAASVAAIVWANTSIGPLHSIAYNVIFVASVSTLIFNGNPLLRYDAYYILSDLIEIPNLAQQARSYLYFCVRKYCWRVRGVQDPSRTPSERRWFIFYGTASTVYRFYICFWILLYLSDRLPDELFFLVPIMGLSAIVGWVFVPAVKFVRYLAFHHELNRTRRRAVWTTMSALGVVIFVLGVLPMPDRCRIEGIVEPVRLAQVHAESDGFVERFLPSGRTVTTGDSLVVAVNPDLQAERKSLLAELRSLQAERRLAEGEETAKAQIIDEKMGAVREKLSRVESQLASLELKPPFDGTWISPDIERIQGMYLKRGEKLGLVAALQDVRVRATAEQELAAPIQGAYKQLEMRVKGRPDLFVRGTIEKISPAGLEELPYDSMSDKAGGSMPTKPQDGRGVKTAEKFFEIWIKPDPEGERLLFMGQRVIARVEMPARSLTAQWWRSLSQLLQRRFHV